MEKQRERLIELIEKTTGTQYCGDEIVNSEIDIDEDDIKRIADHLLSNGVIVLPCRVGDMVDVLFSHNAVVHLWCVDPAEEDYSTSLWRGMAWDIPQKYKEMKFEKFFGTVPEHLYEADAINILVDLTKEEAEAALKGGEG